MGKTSGAAQTDGGPAPALGRNMALCTARTCFPLIFLLGGKVRARAADNALRLVAYRRSIRAGLRSATCSLGTFGRGNKLFQLSDNISHFCVRRTIATPS